MFQKISDKAASAASTAEWMTRDPRYWTLEMRDRLLDGTFYNHLPKAFYDEMEPNGRDYVLIENRRPSAQYRLPGMVGRLTSRKLFAGRHIPRIHHPDKEKRQRIGKIFKDSCFFDRMLEVARLGAVGSVAMTFRIDADGDHVKNPKIAFHIWRAKYCQPMFDAFGELSTLRIQYIATGQQLTSIGFTGLEQDQNYWFVRDFTTDSEITYKPVEENDWNPIDGFRRRRKRDRRGRIQAGPTEEAQKFEEHSRVDHGFGFVPGHWFVNLTGGSYPDGSCTFEDAIPNSIEIDYIMSQLGRGTRYNGAPQLVTIGDIQQEVDDQGRPANGRSVVRGPMTVLGFDAEVKETGDDGVTRGRGDAKLLEMTGQGIKVGLELLRDLRNMALEAIAAARKDPEQMKGPMSGRAMEFLDEEFHDLIMEMRTQYGKLGALPMACKLLHALEKYTKENLNPEQIQLVWPRLFQPTPTDLAQIMPAFQIALDPYKVMQQKAPAPGAAETTTVIPSPTMPTDDQQILTREEIRAWLEANMDLQMLELDAASSGYSDEDGDMIPDDDDDSLVDDGAKPPPKGPNDGKTDGKTHIGPPEHVDD